MNASRRRRRIWKDGSTLEADRVFEIWPDIAALGVELHSFDLRKDGPAVAAITRRLRRHHATDSTYIHLAEQLDTEVWTLDGALARSAADVGLPVKLIT